MLRPPQSERVGPRDRSADPYGPAARGSVPCPGRWASWGWGTAPRRKPLGRWRAELWEEVTFYFMLSSKLTLKKQTVKTTSTIHGLPLAVQWFRLCSSKGGSLGSIPGGDLRSPRLCGVTKKKKRERERETKCLLLSKSLLISNQNTIHKKLWDTRVGEKRHQHSAFPQLTPCSSS